jgi:hypothetical protein
MRKYLECFSFADEGLPLTSAHHGNGDSVCLDSSSRVVVAHRLYFHLSLVTKWAPRKI